EPKESLTIDPRYTTAPVVGSSWDTYITKIEDDRGYTTYDDTAWGLEYLRFGRHYDWNDERGCEEQYTYRTYLRWQILIPKEATISSAFLKLCTRDWPVHDFTAYIGLLDFADCPEFSTVSGSELWDKKVLNVTGWNIEGNWEDEDWVSVNVTEHLKEFTGWSDYAPGNHMGLRIDEGTSGDGSWNYREVYSVDRGSAYAPRLEITFSYPYEDKLVEPIKNWSFEDETEWTLSGGTRTVSSSVYLHGKHSWYVTGSSSQDVVIEQTLSSELVEKTLRNRKKDQKRGIVFGFYYKPDGVIESGDNKGEKNKAGAEIYYEYSGGSKIVCNYTKPDNASKWWHVQVRAELPPTTTLVKVRIRGCPYEGEGFKAWIDLALLGIYYYDKNSTNYGDAALVTTIYYLNVIQHPEWGGFASLGTSITAKCSNGYSVGVLKELKVELLPNDGTETTQVARLTVLEGHQVNSKDYKINPSAQEEAANIALSILEQSIGLTLNLATMGCASAYAKAATNYLKKLKVALGPYMHDVFRVELQHPIAEGGTDYAVWQTYDYRAKLNNEDDRVEQATACYYFDWRYRADGDDLFAIRVSVTVEWYEWDPETPSGGSWVYAGQTELSVIISIVDYW
ncbi:hypothetical protein B6U84_03465, partial [Candidatus Bathyarchaeota archaeon ex4484_40]